MKCKIKLLTDTAKIPTKGHVSDNCYDIYADEDKKIFAFDTEVVKTGVSMQPEHGYGFVVRERSGKSIEGLIVGGGEVDNHYRGEVGVILHNSAGTIKHIKKGERIAQLRPIKLINVEWEQVEKLNDTARGNNGFGSTGK